MEKLQELQKKFLEWWNKFTSKQKTIIICSIAGVVLMFSILGYVLTRPQYTVLVTCESTKEAAEIIELLDGEQGSYTIPMPDKQLGFELSLAIQNYYRRRNKR